MPDDWKVQHGIVEVKLFALPGYPMIQVKHRVGETVFEFLARLFKPAGYDDMDKPQKDEAMLREVMRQCEAGISQRREMLAQEPIEP